jgi:putative membrane protein
MKWMLLPATALVVLAGCSPAADRDSDAAAGAPGSETGMASTDTSMTRSAGATTPVPAADMDGMLGQLAAANHSEIQQAQDAAKKASDATVKQFASQLVTDHKANQKELKQLATTLGASLPDSGAKTEAESASLGELAGKSGKEFDQAFLDAQITAHVRNIDKIRNQLLPAADRPELRDYLQKTASAMEGHLASAKQLKQDLSSGS